MLRIWCLLLLDEIVITMYIYICIFYNYSAFLHCSISSTFCGFDDVGAVLLTPGFCCGADCMVEFGFPATRAHSATWFWTV